MLPEPGSPVVRVDLANVRQCSGAERPRKSVRITNTETPIPASTVFVSTPREVLSYRASGQPRLDPSSSSSSSPQEPSRTSSPALFPSDEMPLSNVPVAPAIPIARVKHPIPWSGMALWLMFILCGSSLLVHFANKYSIEEKILLPSNEPVNVNLAMKNCVLKFSPLEKGEEQSYITLRSWLMLMESSSLPSPRIARYEDAPEPPRDRSAKPPEESEWQKIKDVFEHVFGHHQRRLLAATPIVQAPSGLVSKVWKVVKKLFTPSSVASSRPTSASMNTPWTWKYSNTLSLEVKIGKYRPYFQCLIDFHLRDDFRFNNLTVAISPADSYVDVIATTPLRATNSISFSALHAIMKLESLEAKRIRLVLRDGSLRFALDGDRAMYDYKRSDALVVSSRTAPVTVESSIPVDITMGYRVATRAFIRGYEISTHRDETQKTLKIVTWPRQFVKPEHDSFSLSITMVGSEAPFYVLARHLGEPLSSTNLLTWAGLEHQDRPHLLSYSESLIRGIRRWVMFQPSAPWVALISAMGEYMPSGLWRLVSSDAYLGGNNWFVLFSAGLLQPRTINLQVHIMGLFCRGPENKFARTNLADFVSAYDIQSSQSEDDDDPESDAINLHIEQIAAAYEKKWPEHYPGSLIGHTRHVSTCTDTLMEQSFVVFWKALRAVRTSSTLMVWAGEAQSEIKFSLTSDTVVKDEVTLTDTWLFTIAIGINLVVSCITAFFLARHFSPWTDRAFREGLNALSNLHAASHRLVHPIRDVPPPDWNVNIVRTHFPREGFTLRWNYSLPADTARLAVRIVPSTLWAPKSPLPAPLLPIASVPTEEEEPLLTARDQPGQSDASVAVTGEVMLYLPLSALKVSRLLGVKQKELFLPLQHPGEVPLDSMQSYQLLPNEQYRLRILALNDQGRETAASGWSPLIQPGVRKSFTHFPLIALRRLLPSRSGSLALFVHKHCRMGAPFNVHVIVSEYSLEIRDEEKHRDPTLGSSIDPGDHQAAQKQLNLSKVDDVNLELRSFFGKPTDGQRRKFQSEKWGRKNYVTVQLKGRPTFRRQEGNVNIYEVKASEEVRHFVIDRMAFGDIHFEVTDLTTGHCLATASCGSRQFFQECLDQYHPNDVNSEHGICWKPYWSATLFRGRGSTVPWGKLGVRLCAATARQFARHDMSSKNRLSHKAGWIRFIHDEPAATYAQGSDIVIAWEWETPGVEKPSSIYIHLHDHMTEEHISTLQGGRPIPNTGSHCWSVDVAFPYEEVSTMSGWPSHARARACYFTLSASPIVSDGCKQNVKIYAQSNAFFILRILTLSYFELAYASFCRTHDLEMEHVSEAQLEALGLDTHSMTLKVCQDLREPLPFEQDGSAMYIHCPGQMVVSTTSKVVTLRDPHNEVLTTQAGDGIHVYKSVSSRVTVIENCALDPNPIWWTSSSDIFFIQYGLLDARVFSLIENALWRLRNSRLVRAVRSVRERIVLYLANADAAARITSTSLVASELPFLVPTGGRAVTSRRIQFQIVPMLFHVIVSFFEVWYFCCWPLTVLSFYAAYNYLALDFQQAKHWDTDTSFLSDILFNPSIRFILELPFPGSWIFLICSLWLSFMFFGVFCAPFIEQTSGWERRVFDKIGIMLQSIHIFVVYACVTMFLLWFCLGALINSDAFLPYAVMLGCVAFVTYTLWCNYVQAKEVVLAYISKNQHTLLSVSFDRWFEHHRVKFDYQAYFYELTHAGDSPARLQLKQQMREELRTLRRQRIRDAHASHLQTKTAPAEPAYENHFRVERLKNDTSLTSTETDEKSGNSWDQAPAHQRSQTGAALRQQLCFWVFDKIQLAPETGGYFSFDENGRPRGLEFVKNLPMDARFATLAEVEDDFHRVEDLLVGFDVAMLANGVKYGPRFGYKADRFPLPHQRFQTAIIALPQFPPPEELDMHVKVDLILDFFDQDQDGALNETEVRNWAQTLGKDERFHNARRPQSTDSSRSEDLVMPKFFRFLSSSFSQESNEEPLTAVTVIDLERYYFGVEELDADFETLFPIHSTMNYTDELRRSTVHIAADAERDGEAHVVNWRDDESFSTDFEDYSLDGGASANESDAEADIEEINLPTEKGGETLEVAEESRVEHLSEARVRDQLRTNVNGLKLQYIFKHLTKRSRGQQIDALTKSVPFIARKAMECQVALLTPIFGKGFLLPRENRGSLVHNMAVPDNDDLLTTELKLVHLEMIKDFRSGYRQVYTEMFDSAHTQKAIAEFYDNVIAAKIQLKAARLTNYRIEIHKSELDRSNEWIVTSPRPVSASQAMKQYATFRSRKVVRIREILTVASAAGPYQQDVHVSLITYALVESGMLRPAEIARKSVTLKLDVGGVKQMDLIHPRSFSCARFLQKMIHRLNVGEAMTVSDLTHLVKEIMTKYLWFAEFRVLIALLGIDLRRDELPGRVWVDNEELHDEMLLQDFQILLRDLTHMTRGPGRRGSLGIASLMQREKEVIQGNMRERRNIFKLKKIFDQLSNGSLFLPVDLADEGVLLLTDNRMGFAAVVACLKHLKIGSLDMIGTRGLVSALKVLGIEAHSPVTVVDPGSGSKVSATISDAELLTLFGASLQTDLRSDVGGHLTKSEAGEKWKYEQLPDADEFDWTHHLRRAGWPDSLMRVFHNLTAASPGFMSKSQLSELVQQIERLFQYETSASDWRGSHALLSFEMFHNIIAAQGFSCSRYHSRLLWALTCAEAFKLGELPNCLPDEPLTQRGPRDMTSHETFLASGAPLPEKESGPRMLEVLPVDLVAHNIARLHLQPLDKGGRLISLVRVKRNDAISTALEPPPEMGIEINSSSSDRCFETPFNHIHEYSGYLTFRLFKSVIKRIGVDIPHRGVHVLWSDFAKDPFDVTSFLPDELYRSKGLKRTASKTDIISADSLDAFGTVPSTRAVGNKFLRVGMDSIGLDPTVGYHIQISRLKRQLPRQLMTGLWPEACHLLFQLYLQVKNFESEKLDRVLERYSSDRSVMNRYDMVRPEAIPTLLTALTFEGMSFQMLKQLVSHMKLNLPERDIKRMFDMMDVNHDHSLDLMELLSGFELLLSKLLPDSFIAEVGLSTSRLMMQIFMTVGGLLAFFLFTALSFTSFVAVSTGASTAVQSLLALLGAVGLQSGASQDAHKVEEKMRVRLEAVISADSQLHGNKSREPGKFLEVRMKENKEIVDSIARRITQEATLRAKYREMRPVALRYLIPRRFHPHRQDPRPCLSFFPGDHVRLEPVVLLACGAKAVCPATAAGNAAQRDVSIDETLSWLREGTMRVRSCDVMLQWLICPPLPHGLGLHLDSRTGVISGVVSADLASGTSELAAEVSGVRMRRQTFQITARNTGGAVRARITFQVNPASGPRV